MTKITLIGAGSTVFAQNILGDVLSNPELAHSEIALYDIDAERLATSEIMTRRIGATLGLTDLRVAATTDRRKALTGADFVILMFQIGGYKPATVIDFDIPKKYGLRQTIADTLGIGGIFRALRTIPVVLDVAREMEEVCPRALMMNYVNPMAMISWAVQERHPGLSYVGLCHSVQETSGHLARVLGEDIAQIDYRAAGINHVAFFTRFEKLLPGGGREDLYPRLKAIAEAGAAPEGDKVRFEVLRSLGYFVTESSEHFSEYTPWFIKRGREDLIDRFQVPLDEYIRRCEEQIAEWTELKTELEDEAAPLEVERSNEYASAIIHGMVTGTPHLIYGNLRNEGLISNLPANAAVEVPCHVDHGGIQPVRVGKLPPQLASVMRWQINVQEMTVEAALTGRREHIYHAALLDPHTAAELAPDEIRALCDDLIAAHGNYLPAYR